MNEVPSYLVCLAVSTRVNNGCLADKVVFFNSLLLLRNIHQNLIIEKKYLASFV